jgi:hypothetical protein
MRRDHIAATLRTVSKIGLAIAMTAGSSAAVAQAANEDQSAASPAPAEEQGRTIRVAGT